MSDAKQEFERIAQLVIHDSFRMDPVGATWMGEHAFDSELPDLSYHGQTEFADRIEEYLTALDAVDDVELELPDLADLEILRAFLTKTHFEILHVAAHTWNPMLWNPGTAIHLLLSRDFAPIDERMANVAARTEKIPGFLEQARNTLREMPAIHCETAIAQCEGTKALLESIEAAPQVIAAMDQHIEWLTEQLPLSQRSPRMGAQMYAGILWHALDAEINVSDLLGIAHDHLDYLDSEMLRVARQYLMESNIDAASDPVRQVLEHIAKGAVVTDESVLAFVDQAMASAKAFTTQHDLVTVPDIEVQVIEMPEIHRGVAVAYCDAPGPLETSSVPTFVAVAPTPAQWTPERKTSFYREYNGVQIHNLTIHEAIPGHVLQLALAKNGREQSLTRRFGFSGTFVEGWAVYAEELLVNRGYAPSQQPTAISRLAIKMQQLKMQARMTINAILDISVHTQDMDEETAMILMTTRGFQEEGEASGKWRRALLTAGQLPTYFVGYREVSSLVADLELLHPEWSLREIHDLLLQFGSPAPRHIRTLIGL